MKSNIAVNNNDNKNNLVSFTRTQQGLSLRDVSGDEINNLFPELPNPQLVMYVYPHFAGQDEAPIPGYSTAFHLYEREHYAMEE